MANRTVTLLSKTINHAVAASGMTWYQVARKAKVSKSTISRIKNGTGNPTIEAVIRILRVLGLDLFVVDKRFLGDLIKAVGKPPEPPKPKIEDLVGKGTESWRGIDVDEYMDMVRGRDEDGF